MIKSQLDALQFVLRNDDRGMIPAFGCLHFYGGRVQTSSGVITFDAPWPGNPLDVTVPMHPVIKCMQAAPEEKARIVLNKRGDLMVKVSDYSSKLVPFNEEFPKTDRKQHIEDSAMCINHTLWNEVVIPAMALLRPFISTDATRPWSQFVLLREGAMFATNNVALARIRMPMLECIPYDVLLDVATVDHILRIRDLGHEVSGIYLTSTSLLCDFADGAWTAYRSSATQWPSVASFVSILEDGDTEIAPDLESKINTIAAIAGTATDGVIYLYEHGAITQMDETVARVWCGAFKRGAYMRSSIQQVLGVADRWSPDKYPSPVNFSGKGVQGVLLGLRNASDSIDVLLRGDADE